MGKCKKGGSDVQKGISPTPSSYVSETVDTGDVVHDWRDDMASLEEAISQMDTTSKMPFHFMWHGTQ